MVLIFFSKMYHSRMALETQGTFLALTFLRISLLLLLCFVLLFFTLHIGRTWIRPRTTYWNIRLALVNSSAISWNPHLSHAPMNGKSGVSHLCLYRHKGYVIADACQHAFPYNCLENIINVNCPPILTFSFVWITFFFILNTH